MEDIRYVRPPTIEEHPLSEVIKATIPRHLPDSLLAEAKSLSPTQPYEIGWSRATVTKILQFLTETDVPILGADVYEICDEIFRPAYIGWSCIDLRDKKDRGELSQLEYARMSRDRIAESVNSFADPEDGTVLYTLIFDKGGSP